VKVRHGEEPFQASFQPLAAGDILTFWAVPVSARVVGYPGESARVALILMPPQHSGSACNDISEHSLLGGRRLMQLSSPCKRMISATSYRGWFRLFFDIP
jgi:hypothetical protein